MSPSENLSCLVSYCSGGNARQWHLTFRNKIALKTKPALEEVLRQPIIGGWTKRAAKFHDLQDEFQETENVRFSFFDLHLTP